MNLGGTSPQPSPERSLPLTGRGSKSLAGARINKTLAESANSPELGAASKRQGRALARLIIP